MNRQAQLEQLIDRAATHAALVGDFDGPYSLGVGQRADGEWVLMLDIAENGADEVLEVELDGKLVTVVVRRNFQPPVPLAANS